MAQRECTDCGESFDLRKLRGPTCPSCGGRIEGMERLDAY